MKRELNKVNTINMATQQTGKRGPRNEDAFESARRDLSLREGLERKMGEIYRGNFDGKLTRLALTEFNHRRTNRLVDDGEHGFSGFYRGLKGLYVALNLIPQADGARLDDDGFIFDSVLMVPGGRAKAPEIEGLSFVGAIASTHTPASGFGERFKRSASASRGIDERIKDLFIVNSARYIGSEIATARRSPNPPTQTTVASMIRDVYRNDSVLKALFPDSFDEYRLRVATELNLDRKRLHVE